MHAPREARGPEAPGAGVRARHGRGSAAGTPLQRRADAEHRPPVWWQLPSRSACYSPRRSPSSPPARSPTRPDRMDRVGARVSLVLLPLAWVVPASRRCCACRPHPARRGDQGRFQRLHGHDRRSRRGAPPRASPWPGRRVAERPWAGRRSVALLRLPHLCPRPRSGRAVAAPPGAHRLPQTLLPNLVGTSATCRDHGRLAVAMVRHPYLVALPAAAAVAPPGGPRRVRAPEERESWQGLLEATGRCPTWMSDVVLARVGPRRPRLFRP